MNIRYCIDPKLTRVKEEDKDNIVMGYGLTWKEVISLGYVEEKFEKGAFPEETRTQTKMVIAHQPGIPLANVAAKTMELKEDDEGLKFDVSLSKNSQRAMDVLDAVDRGDLTDVSIGFSLRPNGKYRVEKNEDEEKLDRIIIEKVGLLREISFVDMGAYTTAKVKGSRTNTVAAYRYHAPDTDEILCIYREYLDGEEKRLFDDVLRQGGF